MAGQLEAAGGLPCCSATGRPPLRRAGRFSRRFRRWQPASRCNAIVRRFCAQSRRSCPCRLGPEMGTERSASPEAFETLTDPLSSHPSSMGEPSCCATCRFDCAMATDALATSELRIAPIITRRAQIRARAHPARKLPAAISNFWPTSPCGLDLHSGSERARRIAAFGLAVSSWHSPCHRRRNLLF